MLLFCFFFLDTIQAENGLISVVHSLHSASVIFKQATKALASFFAFCKQMV